MRHEEELLHAERIEAEQRREPIPPKPKPTAEQTYWGRSGAGLDGDPIGEAYVVGSELGVTGPYPPSPIQWNDGTEPSLGESVDWLPDMLTTPHGGSALTPIDPSGEPGDEQA